MESDNDIRTVADFIRSIFDKISSFEKDEDDQTFWFRGEGSINWKTPLVPSSYRVLAETFKGLERDKDQFISSHIKQIENNTDVEFRRKSVPYIISKGIENTSWNRYFLMQHYKINTRLLDWTENCLLALFFALTDKVTKDDNARVWILKPFELNNRTIQIILNSEKDYRIIPSGGIPKELQMIYNEDGKIRIDELTRRYLKMDFESKEDEEISCVYHPLAIYPAYLDERMSAQKACFTIFGNKINGLLSLENNSKKIIDFVTIPKERKVPILKELKLLGIDFTSVYPDLDGLGLSINQEVKDKLRDNRETLFHVLKSFGAILDSNDEE
jgi:hypothetical protein